jgi:S-adenosylmethionine decarboxylase
VIAPALPGAGVEWLVEATGADPARLGDVAALGALLDAIVADLALTPVGEGRWHRFPDGADAPGGVTGLVLLAESHLTVHTFPEHGSLCLNLFCCRPRPRWDFAAGLARHLGATEVAVRELARAYGAAAAPARA